MSSNIFHKVSMRIANLAQLVNGFKEANRKRISNNITADGSAVRVFVAPFDGSLESILVGSPATTESDNSNKVTITITNETTGDDILVVNSFADAFELLEDHGIEISSPGMLASGGISLATFSQFDILSIAVAVTGTPGITGSSVLNTQLVLSSLDGKFAF